MTPAGQIEPLNKKRRRVLFLCTGNSARSQMAEALLRKYASNAFEVHSAGLRPRPIHPLTHEVLKETGIDISHHRSKGLAEVETLGQFFYVIIVCSQAERECPDTFAPAAVRVSWPFSDPSAVEGNRLDQLEAFREVRDAIEEKIRAWLREEVPPDWMSQGASNV